MMRSNTLRNLLALLVALAVTACGEEVIITLFVASDQKISAIEGNFADVLDENGQFGSAIALLGDLEVDGVADLAVGAPLDSDGGPERGAIWILFMDSDGMVDQEAKISSTAGGFGGVLRDGDNFGAAAAGIGDLDGDGILDLAVGAPLDDDGGNDRGAVWILLLRADGTVRDFRKISSLAGGFNGALEDGDQFGASIAMLGDIDSDGVTDLAVGAPLDDDSGTDTGALWILFMNSTGTVKAQQKISLDAGSFNGSLAAGDRFGRALANIGDLNQDGTPDLGVGTPGDDDGGTDRGAVWILYLRTDGQVLRARKLSATEGGLDADATLANGDAFGTAVAYAGDLDLDGITDLVTGAPFDDDGGLDRGAVWILFMNRDGTVNATQKISTSAGELGTPPANNDRFGAAVAGIGNLDGQRSTDLVAGMPLDDDDGIDKGAIRVLFMDDVDTRNQCERFGIFRLLGITDCN
ncbi:MAG: integrin alpha [Gammaproteobacteria bacterium]